jgi:hypothetical protein
MAYIKEQDKNTALTKNCLRQLILNHQLPSVRAGKKYLINMQVLDDFLQGNILQQASPEGSIRKLNERLSHYLTFFKRKAYIFYRNYARESFRNILYFKNLRQDNHLVKFYL